MNKELKQKVEEVKEDIERREQLREIAEEDKELKKNSNNHSVEFCV